MTSTTAALPLIGDPVRFEIVPVPKPRMTQADRWKQRPAVIRYRQFCDQLRAQAKGTLEPRIWLTFYMPMPASWSAKKRAAMNGQPHQQRPDIDNLSKAFLDALCPEDSYVWELHALKLWAEDGAIILREYVH